MNPTRRRLIVASGTFLGVIALTVLISIVLTPKWTSSANVLVGRTPGGGAGELIEAPAVVVERVNSDGFRLRLVRRIEGRDVGSDAARKHVAFLTLRAVMRGTSEVVGLQVKGRSPAEAKRAVELAFELLRDAHRELAEPRIELLRTQLAVTERAHRKSQENLESIERQLRVSSARELPAFVLSNLFQQESARALDLRRQVDSIKQALSLVAQNETRFVEAPLLREDEYSPKRSEIAIIGLLFALVAGGAVYWFAPIWRWLTARD